MNSQERDQLTQFLKQLEEAKAGDKNLEAERLIRETVTRQPDAAYLLVLRSMLVEQALNTAKAQIAQLQEQVRNAPAARESGFLGGGNPWAQSLGGGGGVPGAGGYQLPRSGQAGNAGAFGSGFSNPAGGGVGSFLGSMATTAAGVVAGGFLFQGIESLLGHHSAHGSAWGDTQDGQVAEQTIINNYYDSPDDGQQLAQSEDWGQNGDTASFSAVDDGGFLDDGDDSTWV